MSSGWSFGVDRINKGERKRGKQRDRYTDTEVERRDPSRSSNAPAPTLCY